jgi:Domain of unknown function (DUF4345)
VRRGPQVVLAALSVIPLVIGLLGVVHGARRLLPSDAVTPRFDTHYRYLAGHYVSLALLAWWLIPAIEQHTAVFRLLCLAVFVGGLGRLISLVQVGTPDTMSIAFDGARTRLPPARPVARQDRGRHHRPSRSRRVIGVPNWAASATSPQGTVRSPPRAPTLCDCG